MSENPLLAGRIFARATVSLRQPLDVGAMTASDHLNDVMVCIEPGWVIVDHVWSPDSRRKLSFIPSEQVTSVVFEDPQEQSFN